MTNQEKLKTVILTGATRGIGRAIFEALVGKCALIVTARDKKALEELARLAPQGTIETHVVDLLSSEAIQQFTQSISQPIYGIINNAGICETMRLDEHPEMSDPMNRVMAVNFLAPYYLVRNLAHLLERNGRIINIGSQLGHDGRPGYSAYCASKAALLNVTKVWADELGARGITVNSVDPSWVLTEMAKSDIARMAEEQGLSWDEMYVKLCSSIAQKRFTKPSEVAEVVRFLLSPEGSGITRQNYLITNISHPL